MIIIRCQNGAMEGLFLVEISFDKNPKPREGARGQLIPPVNTEVLYYSGVINAQHPSAAIKVALATAEAHGIIYDSKESDHD
jgi:hypothetical protein